MKPRDLVLASLVFVAACCTFKVGILHEGPKTEKPNHIRLSPDIRLRLNNLSRVELFAGGIHVGTILLDGQAGVYVGADPSESAEVIRKFMQLLNLMEPEERGQYH